jgi:hypothetical protein
MNAPQRTPQLMPPARQAARTVLMVRPASFCSNPETMASNAFQHGSARPAAEILAAARREFEGALAELLRHGVEVGVLDEEPGAGTPDALFPNNWFSTHEDGQLVLYPMAVPNRRRERRPEALAALAQRHGRAITRTSDLSSLEAIEAYVEGTGSLVLDRVHRIAYAARSSRTTSAGVAAACAALGYEPLLFSAHDAQGRAIYHTNVLMALGPRLALMGEALIPAALERLRVAEALERSGHERVLLRPDQIAAFAGNALFLESASAEPLLVISAAAWQSLSPAQRARLERQATPVLCDVATIEQCGGGGIRCMLAEIFLPLTAGTAAQRGRAEPAVHGVNLS